MAVVSVASLADLDAMRVFAFPGLQIDYEITKDIDASATSDEDSDYWDGGKGWEPIVWNHVAFGEMPWGGTLDGANHTITNLFISRDTGAGLFLRFSGTVKDLGVVDCDISGKWNVGAVTGGLEQDALVGGASTISNCYATGAVSGSSNNCGGIAGGMSYGTIKNCYSLVTVDGVGEVGGLVGWVYSGTVENCYSAGEVSGTSNVGGLIGKKDTGGTITACYWDTQTSKQSTSAGGTGKTTAQMKTLATFSTDWDIERAGDWVDETWIIGDLDGDMYPELSWAYAPDEGGAVMVPWHLLLQQPL